MKIAPDLWAAPLQHVPLTVWAFTERAALEHAARQISAAWHRQCGQLGIILDPKMTQHVWGAHCWVTADREKWQAKALHPQCRGCNLVWEESATTLKRDADYVDVFTAQAGEHAHRLIVTGHTGASLLPVMRWQLTEIFLFRSTRSEAELWAEQFTDDRIMQATQLDYSRREFLHARLGDFCRVVPGLRL